MKISHIPIHGELADEWYIAITESKGCVVTTKELHDLYELLEFHFRTEEKVKQ